MKLEGSSIARICRHLPAFAVRSAGDVGPFYSWAKGWDHNLGDGKTYTYYLLFCSFNFCDEDNPIKGCWKKTCAALSEKCLFLAESWRWVLMTNSLGKSAARPANGLKLLPTKCVPKVKSITRDWERTSFCSWMLSRCIVALGKICPLCLLRTHSLLGVQCISPAIAHSFLRVSIPFLPHSGSKEFACSRGIIPVMSQGAHSAFGLSADSIQWSPVTKWKLLYVLSEAWYLFQCVFVLKLLLACFC